VANEFKLLPNPDNIPGAVSSGYQRQNVNLFSLLTGLDTTEPYDNGSGTITIPGGGYVELNGGIFKLTSTITLTKPNQNIAYWIGVSDNGDNTASIALLNKPGVWNPAKKGCYYKNNSIDTYGIRTLNWVSLGTPSSLPVTTFSQTVKGKWTINLQKGWYYADLQSGLGNGTGGNGNASSGGSGGVASTYDSANIIFFHNGKNKLTIKVGGSGGNGGNGSKKYGSGGGGGSGSGETTEIVGLIATKSVKPGKGGDAFTSNNRGPSGGGGGCPGGSGSQMTIANYGNPYTVYGMDGGLKGGFGNSSNNSVTTGAGNYGGGAGKTDGGTDDDMGGGGGGQGLNGEDKADGTAGGYCRIYKLEN
jgi:hypothetical protein